MKLEDYDVRREEHQLSLLHRNFIKNEKRALAEQCALSAHTVVSYVKGLPIESSKYPAIGWLRVENNKKQTEDNNNTSEDQEIKPGNKSFITWNMPAQDTERIKENRCGFFTSPKGAGIVYTACPTDYTHHIKGKRYHCWSLKCPNCMNDTALEKGIETEKQLLRFKQLNAKQGVDVGDIGHWMVSPPQEATKSVFQTREDYNNLITHINDCMQSCGATAGVTVVHPWRQTSEEWQFSPHFHILCYGRIDTNLFKKINNSLKGGSNSWIIKKIHPREQIRSIHHTAAYLFTHMGLPTSEKDVSETDWEWKLLNHFHPVNGMTEKDIEDLMNNKGRTVGDLSDIDWLEWTKESLVQEVRMRYWGGVALNKIRLVGELRRYRMRVCSECQDILKIYDGFDDNVGYYARYIEDVGVYAFSKDVLRVKTYFLKCKAELKKEGANILDFASLIPLAVSDLELGLLDNGDLIFVSKFDEPEEYLLNRQKKTRDVM